MVKMKGFTLIELVMVIVILGILSAFAIPRFADFSSDAKISVLEGIAGTMRSTVHIAQATARANGISPSTTNPGSGQSAYIIETEAGTSELDYRNLCPESSAELGDALDMTDYISLSEAGGLISSVDNQYTRIGYDIPAGNSTTQGCYVLYDSFGTPNCTITVVTNDCDA